jgi:hypothetical protein
VYKAFSVKIAAVIFVWVAMCLSVFAGDGESGYASPNGKLAVARTGEDGFGPYAIRDAVTGRTIAVCPDQGRISAAPATVVWSPDSRVVAIHTPEQRHAGAADFWFITGGKAQWFTATFPDEKGDFYFTPKRWLNTKDLELEVTGKFWKRADSPVKGKLFKSYTLVMRANRKTGSVKVLRSSKPEYWNP